MKIRTSLRIVALLSVLLCCNAIDIFNKFDADEDLVLHRDINRNNKNNLKSNNDRECTNPYFCYFHEDGENELNSLANDNDGFHESPSTRPSTLKDSIELVQIEKNLLTMFGFKERPKVDRSKIVIPEAMKRLYLDITGQKIDSVDMPRPGMHTQNANTVRSFTHEDSAIDERFMHHNRFRLYFNVSSIPAEDRLRAAELMLSRNAFSTEPHIRYQVLAYDILRPGVKDQREPMLLLIDSKSVKISGNTTLSLDVTPAVERWIKAPKKNYGILIHVSPHNSVHTVPKHRHIRLRRDVSNESHEDDWKDKQPILMAYTDDGLNKRRSIRDTKLRSRRPAGARSQGRGKRPTQKICQRKPLYVDFVDVGWSDWIVAPPGYEAFYCEGECQFPIADHLNTTNHAIVQTLVNSISPQQVPRACCVPTQLSSICMLYLDDQNKVVLKNYQDMTVVGCGCR